MSTAVERHGLVDGPSPSGATTRTMGARCFCDHGVTWSVHEDHRCYVGPSLIFESDRIVRRVRNYPTTWEHLADADLIALSWSR